MKTVKRIEVRILHVWPYGLTTMRVNYTKKLYLTFKTIAPPVECPNKKHGKPWFSSNTISSRNSFCAGRNFEKIKRNLRQEKIHNLIFLYLCTYSVCKKQYQVTNSMIKR